MENEGKVLICLPIEGEPDRYIVPGSIEARCADCNKPVYVAPSGQRLQEAGNNILIVCMKCALARLEKEGKPTFQMVPGQDQEIKAWRKRS